MERRQTRLVEKGIGRSSSAPLKRTETTRRVCRGSLEPLYRVRLSLFEEGGPLEPHRRD